MAPLGKVCHRFCFITLHCSSRKPLAKEIFRGNHSDANNIFRWDVISFNLPGNKHYKPQNLGSANYVSTEHERGLLLMI
jgi:hypothetical protein